MRFLSTVWGTGAKRVETCTPAHLPSVELPRLSMDRSWGGLGCLGVPSEPLCAPLLPPNTGLRSEDCLAKGLGLPSLSCALPLTVGLSLLPLLLLPKMPPRMGLGNCAGALLSGTATWLLLPLLPGGGPLLPEEAWAIRSPRFATVAFLRTGLRLLAGGAGAARKPVRPDPLVDPAAALSTTACSADVPVGIVMDVCGGRGLT